MRDIEPTFKSLSAVSWAQNVHLRGHNSKPWDLKTVIINYPEKDIK